MSPKRHDPLTPEKRSEVMSRIRGKDTGPEMVVRRLVHSLGYRYRLHAKDLPGRPDLVFRSRRKVIFVHGCFWHQHGCGRYSTPRSNLAFWTEKLSENKRRDRRALLALKRQGWECLVIWECGVSKRDGLSDRITTFLEG